MFIDEDDFDKLEREWPEEVIELDKLLGKLQDADLSEWDQDFVDDMAKRLGQRKDKMTVTPRQWEQLQRMERQYL